jgi:integrase/recombinase XerD
MAHLVRPWIVLYIDPQTGRRVPKGTPGAKRKKDRASKWYGQGIPGVPSRKRTPLATDKTVAQRMLADRVEQAERGEAGMGDPFAEHRRRPLTEHLGDFRRYLEAKGKTTKHVRQTAQHVQAALSGCGFALFADLAPMPVVDWLTAERKAGRIGATTVRYYVRDLKAFLRWMVKFCSAPKNPLDALEWAAEPGEQERARRELPPDELLRVFDAARSSAQRFKGLDGPARYHLYLTACATGFRAKELAALVPASFRLDDDPPAVHLAGRRTKSRKRAHQPLPSGVAAALRVFLEGKAAGQPVWPGSWRNKAAEMLRIDLEAAGVPYVVEGPDGPLHADFHALRHSYITMLEQAGATPAEAQRLARHSDIRLTLQRYTHVGMAGLGATVERLALPAGNGAAAHPLAVLTRAELEAAVVGLLGILTAVLRPCCADPETDGDSGIRPETATGGQGSAA